MLRRNLKRAEMEAFFGRLEATEVVMEACGGAHHWSRLLSRLSHRVRLIPANAEDGAQLVRDFVVKLYDKQDGKGVDWKQIGGTLFKAAFDVLAELPMDQKRTFAGRVHERSYEAMTDEPAASNFSPSAADQTPSNTGVLKSPRPRPPK